VICT